MRKWLRSIIERHVVANVPDEMDLCLTCGKLQCSETEYQNCVHRKARAAALAAAPRPTRLDVAAS